MLNGLGEIQRVLVLGGKSDLAIEILSRLPISEDAEVILAGRRMQEFKIPDFMKNTDVNTLEVDFVNLEKAKALINGVFQKGDIDFTIIALGTDFAPTLVAGTGVTLVGEVSETQASMTFTVNVTSPTTVTIYRK